MILNLIFLLQDTNLFFFNRGYLRIKIYRIKSCKILLKNKRRLVCRKFLNLYIFYFRMKNSNQDLKDQITSQNEKIENLENTIKDHEERIEKRKN